MKQRLARPLTDASYEMCVEEFLNEYEFIFTTSLFAEIALQDLARSLPKKTALVTALQYFSKDMREPLIPPTDIIGNTFELVDIAPFLASHQEGRGDLVLEGILEEKLCIAQEFLRLREYGRWLALRHISRIRRQIPRVLAPHASAAVLLPSVITDLPIPHITKPLGVSLGKGTGKLTRNPNEGGILIVSSLTPELGAYADRLQGVIADHGGLLSHFAIIAREKGLPVIVNYPTRDLCVGQEVSMDGTTGEVIFL